MNLDEVIEYLKEHSSESIKKVLINHGAREPFYGVKVGDLKPLQKKIKKNYDLSLELYNTGISDAMYLAGLIADEKKMTREDLQNWAENAYWHSISLYTVAWVAAESKYGWELALEWIDSESELIAAGGWATLAGICSLKNDDELDIDKYSELLDYIAENIHKAPNWVRYTMNSFVISVGTYIEKLREKAINVGVKIGKVNVNMGNTACKVPLAPEYITKSVEKNSIVKKKKTVRC
jgi:3-methyladenine DNA glycosylase AlkD